MALRVDYLARETGQNLVRNLLLSVATVLVVAISSVMLGMTLLGRNGVDNAFARWNNDVSFIVYVNPDATEEQIASLRKDLTSSPQVDEIVYLDHEASYADFKKLFADEPTIVETVTAEQLPTSFRVKPKNPDARVVQELAQSYEAKPGVYKVDFVADAVRAVQRFASKFQGAMLTASIVLLLVSAAIIFVTIQLAVFSRRQEIEVMHLVGATNWYIRIPFVLEGIIQGLLGAGLAALTIFLLGRAFAPSAAGRATPTLFDSIRWTGDQVRATVILVLLIGPILGAISSFVSVSWYLRDARS